MALTRIDQLRAATSPPAGSDLVEGERDPAGSPSSEKLTWDQVAQSVAFSGRYAPLGAGGAGGATDLTYNPGTRVLSSSTGTDATIPTVVAGGNSGLMTGADKTILDGLALGGGGGGGGDHIDANHNDTFLRLDSFPVMFEVTLSSATTTVGEGVLDVMHAPHAFTITEVRATLVTAGTVKMTIDILRNNVSIFGSPKLSIDANETSSITAAAPADLMTTSISDDDRISFSATGTSSPARLLRVAIYGVRSVANVGAS